MSNEVPSVPQQEEVAVEESVLFYIKKEILDNLKAKCLLEDEELLSKALNLLNLILNEDKRGRIFTTCNYDGTNPVQIYIDTVGRETKFH